MIRIRIQAKTPDPDPEKFENLILIQAKTPDPDPDPKPWREDAKYRDACRTSKTTQIAKTCQKYRRTDRPCYIRVELFIKTEILLYLMCIRASGDMLLMLMWLFKSKA